MRKLIARLILKLIESELREREQKMATLVVAAIDGAGVGRVDIRSSVPMIHRNGASYR